MDNVKEAAERLRSWLNRPAGTTYHPYLDKELTCTRLRDEETLARAYLALAARPADEAVYVIEPLKWEDSTENDYGGVGADTPIGRYGVGKLACRKWWWWLGSGVSVPCESLASGKLTAEAHYRERMERGLRRVDLKGATT